MASQHRRPPPIITLVSSSDFRFCTWLNMASDFPPVFSSILAREVESNFGNDTLRGSRVQQQSAVHRMPISTRVLCRWTCSNTLGDTCLRPGTFGRHTVVPLISFIFLWFQVASQHSPDLIGHRRPMPCGFQIVVYPSGTRCFRGGARVHSNSNRATRILNLPRFQILCRRPEDRKSLRQSIVICTIRGYSILCT